MTHIRVPTIEGTPDQIAALLGRLPNEKRYRLVEVSETPLARVSTKETATRVSAMGKYAFVPGGSEEFAREKQAEIEREDRAR